MTNEKFCLRWNDFETNISVAFRELRDDKDFFDVTLACEDEQIQAHKMILSACSPFFKNILRRNSHQHPLLYLKGVKFTDLQSVLNFMYHGEVNIAQEDLNSFLSVAEDLRVKGLTQNQADQNSAQHGGKSGVTPKTNQQQQQTAPKDNIPSLKRPRPGPPSLPVSATPAHFSAPQSTEDEIQEVVPVKTEPRDHPTPVVTPSQGSYSANSHSLAPVEDDSYGYQDDHYEEYDQYQGDLVHGGTAVQADYAVTTEQTGQKFQDPKELLQFVRKDPTDNKFHCTLCENFSHKGRSMTGNHVESQHFPNTFSYSCDLCGEILTTKSNLWLHRSRRHLNKKQNMDY